MTQARRSDILHRLPHRPPMRLVEEVVELTPGKSARTSRLTRADDWFFQGHFPGQPVVPAIVLVELLAQTGGLAIGADAEQLVHLRVAAIGRFKFPSAAGVDVRLEATVRVVGRMGPLIRIEGTVTAGPLLVAEGDVTLADVAPAGT
jgi:3-hydroxyacyl-[acyl-carrier-protein] dehydratase